MYNHYFIKQSFISVEEKQYVTYGIAYEKPDGEIAVIEDVSIDEGFVRDIADRFNKEKLDPASLPVAIENFLP